MMMCRSVGAALAGRLPAAVEDDCGVDEKANEGKTATIVSRD
jgi:hypothetical protein